MKLGKVTRRQVLEKRRWPAEVQSAIDDFEDEFGTLARDIREDLVDELIAGRTPTSADGIATTVRQVIRDRGDEVRVVLSEGAQQGARAGRAMASRRFGLEIDFEVVPDSTLEELEEFTDDVHDDVLDTIGDGVERTLQDAFEEGLDRDAIADIIQSELDNELGDAAAQRHARTLVQGASERGNHSAIKESSAIGEKWVATSDNRTRDTHASADGQIVPVGETFLVGGAELLHPGDPGGAIEEIANCRCTGVPVFPSDVSDQEEMTLRNGGRLNV